MADRAQLTQREREQVAAIEAALWPLKPDARTRAAILALVLGERKQRELPKIAL